MRGLVLQTERLTLRTFGPSWAGRVARFYDENWHFHQQWEPLRPNDYFTAGYQARILRAERRSDSTLHLWLLPTGTRTIIGSITLSSIVRGFFQNCFLGYKMDERYTRRGYMREALEATLDHAFGAMGLHRVEANIMPRNRPSYELVSGLGFREEGLAHRYLQIQGTWEDHLHMVLLREWRHKTYPQA